MGCDMEWNKSSEILPVIGVYVLVYKKGYRVFIAEWSGENSEWFDEEGETWKGMTHWMPLPNPPEA